MLLLMIRKLKKFNNTMHNKIKYTGKSAILIAVFIAIGMSSCRTSKNVSDLSVDTKDLIRDENINTSDSTTIADTPWQEYFSDDILKQLIQEALDNNLDMKVALERIKQAEANFAMAKAAKLPTLSVAAQDEYTLYSIDGGNTKVLGYNANTLNLGLTTSWEIDAWGKLNSTKKAQYANLLNTREYKKLVQTNIISGVAQLYYTLLSLDEQLKVTKETIGLLSESSQTMQALKDAGLTNGAAVEQSNALLYNTQMSVFTIEDQIRQQENALCVLLGKAPGTIARNTISQQDVPAELKYGVPAQLLAKRPDVLSAELSFRAAFEATNAAQASLYPSITLSSGFVGYNGTELSDFFKPENIAANFVAGIAQPIFYNKRLKGNLAISKSQQEEALLNFKNTVLTAGQEVSDILFSFKSSVNKNTLRIKQIDALSNAVDFTQELLKAGEANYTEVLSAQQNLLSAQLSQVNDKLEQLNYSVGLYKALGGGTN